MVTDGSCWFVLAGAVVGHIQKMNLKLVRPSSDAPESLALYEKLRAMSDDSDQEILDEVLGGLFSIVARLESERNSDE
jgi:hypothetical protein